MKNNKIRNYLICIAVFIVIGAVFKFALIGYKALAYGFWALALIAVVLLVLTLLEKKNQCPINNKGLLQNTENDP